MSQFWCTLSEPELIIVLNRFVRITSETPKLADYYFQKEEEEEDEEANSRM
jgi:hypothetical protein